MKLTIKESSTNYACSVVEIKEKFEIENADAICRVVVDGNNVVVPKTTEVGAIMLYFVAGTKLSADYCKNNNLYDKPEENLDTNKKSFISFRQKRVKALKLRGIISNGMLMPLDSLFSLVPNIANLKVGDEFTDIDNISICEKYIVPVKISNSKNKGQQSVKISRLVENQFYLHGDTSNLRKEIHRLNPNDLIEISYKKHGSSIVIGNVKVKIELTWFEKILKKFKVKLDETKFDIVYSSRKVIKNGYLNPTQGEGFYGEDIWGVVAKEVGHLIPKGFTLYGEILGYTPSGSPIQGKFDYGCLPGEHKFYVYKISIVNEDGKVIFLSTKQIEEFCEKVGLSFKDTLMYYGYAKNLYPQLDLSNHWRENFLSQLEKDYNEKNCYMCKNKVPEEGIILRIDRLEEYECYKLKSKKFLLMESEEQEQEITNIEDNQDETN